MKGLWLVFLVLVITFCVGVQIGVFEGINPDFWGILWYLGRVAIKFIAIALTMTLLLWIISNGILYTPLGTLVESLHSHADNQENLSPVMVVGGLLVAVVQIFGYAQGTTAVTYFYEVLTKGSVGLFIGLVMTILLSFLVGVKSMKAFAAYCNDPTNNQIIAYCAIVFNIAVFVAMLS